MGYKGIRQWSINCYTSHSPMMIHKITPYLDYNYFYFMNQPITIQWKSPKLLSQQRRKRYHKTSGTGVVSNRKSLHNFKHKTFKGSNLSSIVLTLSQKYFISYLLGVAWFCVWQALGHTRTRARHSSWPQILSCQYC